MTGEERKLRQAIIDKCRFMNATGLNQGTSGNISARHQGVMLITPSATPYDVLRPEMIAAMPIDGKYGSWSGPLKPSVEWRFHLDIMRERPDVAGIVHTHSTFATVLSIARCDIPACHYMIAAFGGNSVRCAEYARYGTAELSANALRAMKDRQGCLLANHGMIAAGPTLERAMWLAVELETLARQYYYARQAGGMALLTDDEIADVIQGFAGYGAGVRATSASDGARRPRKAGRKSFGRAV